MCLCGWLTTPGNPVDSLQFLAKAFLERDYEAIRATKTETQMAQDVTMSETAVKPEREAGEQAPEKAEKEVDIKIEQTTKDVTTNSPAPAAAEPSQPNEPDQHVKIEQPSETPAVPDQSTAETKFDTELNETAGGAANEFDLHLDFGNDEIGNQNFLNMNTGGGTNEADGSGFGSSIPSGGDAFDLEFEKAGAITGGEQQPQQQQHEQPQPQTQPGTDSQTGDQSEDIMAPGESSFDDLFMGSGEMGDQGLLEGDELMNINELDDNWFT